MSHPPTSDPPEPPPPADSLARIAAIAAELRVREISPPEAFVWTYRDESRWWAFGRFGRYTVMTPRRFGWGVGDYPWEDGVKQGQGSISSEVFVKPTFVDAAGRIAPLAATRVTLLGNHLLTDAMLQEIADRMEQIAADSA